jgi:hypothetical protein
MDIVEQDYYRGKTVPKVDRMLWTVQIDGCPPVSARIGAGREGLVSDADVRVESLSGLGLDTRTLAILEIPSHRLGTRSLADGDRIELHSVLTTHGRAYSVGWKGTFMLRGDE